MTDPIWVRRDVILSFHELLLAQHGGMPGLRDQGMFDSAIGRPENLLNYGDPNIYDLAASYAYGLVKNHPFLDGNKRIGFATAGLFLELNHIRFHASEADAVLQTLALAAGESSEAEYAAWLKANSTPA